MKDSSLTANLSGTKIRCQYFNIPIYFLLWIDLGLLCIWVTDYILGAEFTSHTLTVTIVSLSINSALLPPLLVLSLLNRFVFGKVICVVDDQGLYYKDGLIRWSEIKKAEYHPDFPSAVFRQIFCCNSLHLTIQPFQKELCLELDHAPFLLLRIIKKHCPGIRCKISRWGYIMILGVSLGLIVISVLCALAN